MIQDTEVTYCMWERTQSSWCGFELTQVQNLQPAPQQISPSDENERIHLTPSSFVFLLLVKTLLLFL